MLDKNNFLVVSSKWNDQIRNLYSISNKEMNVSETLTSRVLNDDLCDPTKFYTQKGNVMILLILNSTLVGMVGVEKQSEDVAKIQRVTIHSKYRCKGLGYSLMKYTNRFILFNLKYKFYALSCIATNIKAIDFYRRLSFLSEYKITTHFSDTDNINYNLVHFKNYNLVHFKNYRVHVI